MPAHITHLLFGEEALRAALGPPAEEILEGTAGNFFRFGCQGPDFFYHNQRTRPTALRYGVLIHQSGYGRLVAGMIRESRRRKRVPAAQVAAFILGFATHAALDRKTHPFINYFSGWVDPRDRKTRRYYRCHAYLERILDVLMLSRLRDTDISTYRFLPRIDCGEELPYDLLKVLIKSLHQAYPQSRYKSRDRLRVRNAYQDAIYFYQLTEPSQPHYRRLAREHDLQEDSRQRRLALFHPLEVPPGIDFLNLEGRVWCHPCFGEVRSGDSFPRLYEEALADAVPALRGVWAALQAPPDHEGGFAGYGPLAGYSPLAGGSSASGDRPAVGDSSAPGDRPAAGDDPAAAAARAAEELAERIGNASLDTGLEDGRRCTPVHCDPLPLPELIDALYR